MHLSILTNPCNNSEKSMYPRNNFDNSNLNQIQQEHSVTQQWQDKSMVWLGSDKKLPHAVKPSIAKSSLFSCGENSAYPIENSITLWLHPKQTKKFPKSVEHGKALWISPSPSLPFLGEESWICVLKICLPNNRPSFGTNLSAKCCCLGKAQSKGCIKNMRNMEWGLRVGKIKRTGWCWK